MREYKIRENKIRENKVRKINENIRENKYGKLSTGKNKTCILRNLHIAEPIYYGTSVLRNVCIAENKYGKISTGK